MDRGGWRASPLGRKELDMTEQLHFPVLLPGKSHGQRSLVGCSPWGHRESDTNEQLCHKAGRMYVSTVGP